MSESSVLSVTNLHKRFNLEAGFFARLGRYVNAVNGISLQIGRNESYGLVGESGCGKTTTARLLVRMYEADQGEILYRGQAGEFDGPNINGGFEESGLIDVRKLKGPKLKRYREKVKYIFQDPARSLNPRMTVYEVLSSGAEWSSSADAVKALRRDEAAAILEEVGLSADDLERRPAEFSVGQRQRISIARGLMMKPRLLICDEVVSALDVSIQGQILNLLLDLREHRKASNQELSFLFIAHDLKVASYFCDRIGVMYRGEIMEEAPATELWNKHLHPYTELLFSSAGTEGAGTEVPERPAARQAAPGQGEADLSEGCAFAGRCPYAEERCSLEKPELRAAGEGAGHLVRCWR